MPNFWMDALQGLAVCAAVTLVLAAVPWFRPEHKGFARRFSWFFVRYTVGAYAIILLGRWFALYLASNHS